MSDSRKVMRISFFGVCRFVALCAAFFSMAANAAQVTGKVVEVRPDSLGNGVVIRLVGPLVDTTPCTYPDTQSQFFFVPTAHSLFDQIFTVALSAQLSEREVFVKGDGTCGNQPGVDIEIIRNIKITD